eukprot:g267.t1
MDDDDNYKNNIEHFAKNPYGGDISSAGILPPSSTSGQNIMPGSKEGRAAARILSKRETKFDEKGLLELGLQPKLLLAANEIHTASNESLKLQGMFGKGNLGLHKSTIVSVRLLQKNLIDSDEAMKVAVKELNLHGWVRMPTIAMFLGASIANNAGLKLVYESGQRDSLHAVLYDSGRDDRFKFSYTQVLRMGIDLASSLSYLHELDPPRFHHGITTFSVLIDENDNLKLADIGSQQVLLREYYSKVYHPSQDGTYVISDVESLRSEDLPSTHLAPHSIPPEFVSSLDLLLNAPSDHNLAARIDVYQVGMLLWEMMNARTPQETPPDTTSCDVRMASLLQSCWARDANERPPIAIVLSRLRQLLEWENTAHEGVTPHFRRSVKEYNSPSDVQILLVDDDELACRSLQQTLRKCGYGVISCNSGPKALELLWASVRTNTSRGESRSTFDLVMLDVLMPDMDGLEVINAIRQSPMLRGIPIAAVSANTDINSIQQAINIGANEYMVKPVSSNMVQPLVIKLQQWQDGELRSDMDGSSEESKSSSVASHGSSSADLPSLLEDEKPAPSYDVIGSTSGGDIRLDEVEGQGLLAVGTNMRVTRGRWRNKSIAIKRLRITSQATNGNSSAVTASTFAMGEFRNEVAILRTLKHKNIVNFLGYHVAEPWGFVFTEYEPRGSLMHYLSSKECKASFQERLLIVIAAANGLDFLHHAHEHSIVHRDIKTSNMLMTYDHSVRICDFGLSKVLTEGYTSTRCGSPAWIAPEVMLGRRYNEQADVYAFGIVAWEILSGERPYAEHASDVETLMRNVCNGDRPKFTLGDYIAEEESVLYYRYCRLTERCWAAQPKERPEMREVREELDRILEMAAAINVQQERTLERNK